MQTKAKQTNTRKNVTPLIFENVVLIVVETTGICLWLEILKPPDCFPWLLS